MNKLFLLLILILVFGQTHAQEKPAGISKEQAIDFLNKKLGKNHKIELIKEKQIVITFYKKGSAYKTDKAYLETLDTNDIKYSEEEKMLIIRCKDEEHLDGRLKKFRDGCVEREIPEKDMVGQYARINLEVGSEMAKIESIKKAFIHLIKLEQEEGYSSNIPFE